MNYIYVMISGTHSKWGRLIRAVLGTKYNHAALAFDENLEELYSFARKQYMLPLDAGFVKETIAMYTMRSGDEVPIMIFKIPVDSYTYQAMLRQIYRTQKDKAYMYNLFSALTFPLLHGFPTYKAYTCIEFVVDMLKIAGIEFKKSSCSYEPAELVEILGQYEFYTGNLLEYKVFNKEECKEFFQHKNILQRIIKSVVVIALLIQRQMLIP